MRYASVVLVESVIVDCAASGDSGGGLQAYRANVTLKGGSRIERCYARMGGGALLAGYSDVALLDGSVLSGCSGWGGGGMFLSASRAQLTQSSIINCSATYGAGGIFATNRGETTLVDSHIRDCHATGYKGGGGDIGGFRVAEGRLTMIRGAITGCSAVGRFGGANVGSGGTLSLIDVLVADCRADAEGGGGGVSVNDGTLTMSGGAVRNCQAPNGKGGGLLVASAVAQVQLSGGATVDGCTAAYGGGMHIEYGEVSLINVSLIQCAAGFFGGAIQANAGSVLHASRVRVARCHAAGRSTAGGAVYLGGFSTWIDSTFSDCTSSRNILDLSGGVHTLTRIAILRCHAMTYEDGGSGDGGGLGVEGATVTMVDSRIADSSASGSGGCIHIEVGALFLRNTTFSNCSAQQGPYIHFNTDEATFVSEMLTLEPSCEAEQRGALITGAFTTPLAARGLRVYTCASSTQAILNHGLRLLRCSDGSDMCGAAATCTNVAPLPSAPNLTTVDCSCTGESFPSPSAASVALAPYGIDPSNDYCVTPRVASKAALRGFILEEVLRLSKTDTSNSVHTLDLEIDMDGTNVAPAAWTFDASSVPAWLSLPLQGGIGATEQTCSLPLTANTSGLPERLGAPYEALLNLSITSQRDRTFLVFVKLYVSAPALGSTSIWGRPTSERVCHVDAQGHGDPTETVLGEITNIPFTACDVDNLAIEHDATGNFEALLVDRSSGAFHSLSITFDLPGTYMVAVQAPHLGEFGLQLTFTAADGTTEQVGVERTVRAVCPSAKEMLPNGLNCGCQRGTVFNEKEFVCERCPRGTSSAAGGSDCGVCAEDFYATLLDNTTAGLICEPCLSGATCPWDVSLMGVQTKPNYWRLAPESDDVLECITDFDNQRTPCLGGAAAACLSGHSGPKCRVCVEELHYVGDDNICTKCPSGTVPALVGSAVLAIIIILLYLVALLLNRPPKSLKTASDRLKALIGAVQSLGPAKLKAALTFYQIVMSLPVSFDLAPLDIELVRVLNVFAWLEFDWSEAVYPSGCIIGGFFNRLVLVALAPFLLILAVPTVLCLLGLLTSLCARKDASGGKVSVGQALGFEGVANQSFGGPQGKEESSLRVNALPLSLSRRESSTMVVAEQLGKWQQRLLGTLPLVLLVVFVMLPAVSRSIFSAWDCIAFKSGPDSEVRYLRRELAIVCGSEEHERITALAWMLVIIWPIGMQLLFGFTLWFNRKAMAAGTNNAYTRATRFLTGGYKSRYFYWETVELFRRLTCSGFIMLIPHQYIFLRIALAIAVSIPILVMTAFLQPVKNLEDTVLGITGQMIMLFAFCCCVVIRILNSQDLDDGDKGALLGFTSPKGIFLALGLCFVVFFIVILGSYAYRVTLILKKQGGTEAKSSAAWMVWSASFSAIAALVLGSAAYGMAGGIVSASVFFVIGGAVGAVMHARVVQGRCGQCRGVLQSGNSTESAFT